MTQAAFRPQRFLSNPHAQTIVPYFAGASPMFAATVQHRVALPDADTIILHEDRSRETERSAALLIHGLGGCHASPYMCRLASKLIRRGVRTFRMDLRGCGAGAGLAVHPYHAGRSDDLDAALECIARLCPDLEIALVGFSLGGNIVLKWLAELRGPPSANVSRAVAVCPPIDLRRCVSALPRALGGMYERYFTRLLLRRVRENAVNNPNAAQLDAPRRPRSLYEFDDVFTAPRSGFESADHYYRECSSAAMLPEIRLPTRIVAARDDPLVLFDVFEHVRLSDSCKLLVTDHGGHVGFIGRSGVDPDRWWLDWRIVDWLSKP